MLRQARDRRESRGALDRGRWVRSAVAAALLGLLLLSSALHAEPRVRVLLSSNSRIYEEGLAGIRSALPNAKIESDYLNIVRAEYPEVSQYYRELEKAKVDLVIGIGPAAAASAIDNLTSIPVLFALVNSPKQLRRPNRSVCGVSMDIPVAEYFSTLREIDPKRRRVYAFYSTPEGRFLAQEGAYFDLKHGLSYHMREIQRPEDFEKELEKLKGRMDAFFMIPDPLFDRRRFQIISDFAKKNGIVLMTGFEALVRIGATFGYSPDFSKSGILAGEMARRILKGKSSCSEEGIQIPDRSNFLFHLNPKYARGSGVQIPEEIVRRASLVRLSKMGVRFFNEKKFKSAKRIFEAILKEDPKNDVALYYAQAILEKLTGDQIQGLFAQAEKQEAEKDYRGARRTYLEILSINSALDRARRGAEQARLSESQVHLERGRAFARSGKPFDAIRSFQSALSVLPGNQAAQSELAAVRGRMRGRVGALTQEGIAQYRVRNYGRAIQLFEDILLVIPGDKKASEYLRLSRTKLRAIRELKDRLKRYGTR